MIKRAYLTDGKHLTDSKSHVSKAVALIFLNIGKIETT